MAFQCYGKSMGQKFLMLPQTITVDLSTKTNHHTDNMDKEIRKGGVDPSLGIYSVIFKRKVVCCTGTKNKNKTKCLY